jgi:hypothetical protein
LELVEHGGKRKLVFGLFEATKKKILVEINVQNNFGMSKRWMKKKIKKKIEDLYRDHCHCLQFATKCLIGGL